MPTADTLAAAPFVKIILVGDSGAGKTGALASLVPHYDLRILDFDMGTEALINIVKRECPDRLSSISIMSFRDKTKLTNTGPKLVGSAQAWQGAMKALDKWEDGTTPSEWGPKAVLVIDSLTLASQQALNMVKGIMVGVEHRLPLIGRTQDFIRDMLSGVTDKDFKTNVIIISHIDRRETTDDKGKVLEVKEQVKAIGEALGADIPIYFNTMVLSEPAGFGASAKRKLKTVSTYTLKLKNPGVLLPDYPIETGLADIFKALKG